MKGLIKKIEEITREAGARRATSVCLCIGPLVQISDAHLREHFLLAAKGTPAEGARLKIRQEQDVNHRHAQEIVLESVNVEE